jgi:hypothetical protein
MLSIPIAFILGYLAYRIVRNGFSRPQSEKWNGFGIAACIVLLLVLASWIEGLF